MVNNKKEANYNERLVAYLLKLQYPKAKIRVKNTHGFDITFDLECQTILIEVKSCRQIIRNSNGYKVKGRFFIENDNFDSDIFCFLVKEMNYLYFISSECLRTYLHFDKGIKFTYKIAWNKLPIHYANSFDYFISNYCYNKNGHCTLSFSKCKYNKTTLLNSNLINIFDTLKY